MTDILGLDIGGANLKAVHSSGEVRSMPFALWKQPEALADMLAELLASMPNCTHLAITMTGELCDCFASKREGVHHILEAVTQVADGRPVRVWSLEGHLKTVVDAKANPYAVAASNWHALATLVAKDISGRALLLDIGSTTTDIIPLQDGRVIAQGRSDPERLRTGELVYTGATRTPLCALGEEGLASELFATTLDVHVVLGHLAEQPDNYDTADGRPTTLADCHARLARMMCADSVTSGEDERILLARRLAQRQRETIESAVCKVVGTMAGPLVKIVVSGSGAFVAEQVLDGLDGLGAKRIRLAEQWGESASHAACAYAVAKIYRD